MGSDATEALSFYQLWAWVETNRKQVAWGAVALAAATFIAWFFFVHQDAKEIAASEALSAAAAPQVGVPGAGADTAEAYLRVAATYPNSSAAARAVLLGAASLFVEGKYDQAKLQFERFTREHRDSPFMGQALLGIAACKTWSNATQARTSRHRPGSLWPGCTRSRTSPNRPSNSSRKSIEAAWAAQLARRPACAWRN